VTVQRAGAAARLGDPSNGMTRMSASSRSPIRSAYRSCTPAPLDSDGPTCTPHAGGESTDKPNRPGRDLSGSGPNQGPTGAGPTSCDDWKESGRSKSVVKLAV
jgi:hypothetical protein